MQNHAVKYAKCASLIAPATIRCFFLELCNFQKKKMKIEKVFTFHNLCRGWSDVKILLIIFFKELLEKK